LTFGLVSLEKDKIRALLARLKATRQTLSRWGWSIQYDGTEAFQFSTLTKIDEFVLILGEHEQSGWNWVNGDETII